MARVRTFIGSSIGEEIRANAVSLQQTLAKLGIEVNWVPPENLHITLLFLGDVDERDLATVCRTVARTVMGEPSFALRVSGVGAFPNPRRPKTLWAGITDGAKELVRLFELLEEPLLDLGAYRREERAYTPHLTLGRVRTEEAGHLLAHELPKRLAWDGGKFAVDEVRIFSSSYSDGSKGPPTYSVLGRAPLG